MVKSVGFVCPLLLFVPFEGTLVPRKVAKIIRFISNSSLNVEIKGYYGVWWFIMWIFVIKVYGMSILTWEVIWMWLVQMSFKHLQSINTLYNKRSDILSHINVRGNSDSLDMVEIQPFLCLTYQLLMFYSLNISVLVNVKRIAKLSILFPFL